jgi:hypothetical protein
VEVAIGAVVGLALAVVGFALGTRAGRMRGGRAGQAATSSIILPVRVRSYADFVAAAELFVSRVGVYAAEVERHPNGPGVAVAAQALREAEELLARSHAAVRILSKGRLVEMAADVADIRGEVATMLLEGGGVEEWRQIDADAGDRTARFAAQAQRELIG